VQEDAGTPGPAHGVGQPAVGRATPVVDAETLRYGLLVVAVVGLRLERWLG
jgi:hypothetical protein